MLCSDPFAGWLNETGSAPSIPSSQTTPASSAACYAYSTPLALDQVNTHTSTNEYSSVSPQLGRTFNAAHTLPIGPFQQSSGSPQSSPANAGPGEMRYSPSHAQASRSLEQMQYSPRSSTHTQAHLGASQYPLSPVQTGIANARYSPSRGEISYEYSPTPDFISSLFATTYDPTVGDANVASTDARTHISRGNQAGCATSRSLSGGTHDATEKHRSFIVHHVPLDTSHRSIVMLFPVSCYTNLIMGQIKADFI